jgi:hypothetical protein
MGWQDLLEGSSGPLVAPWLGGRRIYSGERTWRVIGKLPREFSWYLWELQGRTASWLRKSEPDADYGFNFTKVKGYLLGDRIIPDGPVDPRPEKLYGQTKNVHLIEEGLDRFSYVQTVIDPDGRFIYSQQLFPLGPEDEVRRAFIDRKESVDHIAGVVPALDLAFRFATHQRQLLEERRAELERIREEERRREEAMRNMGTGLGRRTLAATDFETAARAALAVGGAELLDVRPGHRNEMIVQYRFQNRRLECVAHKDSLQIIDSGICLEDHRTREKGDTYFTLESLPAVVQQAIREGRLVVYRHVDGDVDDDDYWED